MVSAVSRIAATGPAGRCHRPVHDSDPQARRHRPHEGLKLRQEKASPTELFTEPSPSEEADRHQTPQLSEGLRKVERDLDPAPTHDLEGDDATEDGRRAEQRDHVEAQRDPPAQQAPRQSDQTGRAAEPRRRDHSRERGSELEDPGQDSRRPLRSQQDGTKREGQPRDPEGETDEHGDRSALERTEDRVAEALHAIIVRADARRLHDGIGSRAPLP